MRGTRKRHYDPRTRGTGNREGRSRTDIDLEAFEYRHGRGGVHLDRPGGGTQVRFDRLALCGRKLGLLLLRWRAAGGGCGEDNHYAHKQGAEGMARQVTLRKT